MNKAYKYLFNGFLLVMLDLNIGSFDILPDVIGYILVFSGLGELYIQTEIKAFSVARVFSILMAISAGFEMVRGILGGFYINDLMIFIIMVSAGLIELLLVVYIYHGMAAHMHKLNVMSLFHQFNKENKIFALIQGISLIAMCFSLNMPKASSGVYLLFPLVISIIMHIRLLININLAKKLVETDAAEVMGE